MAKSDVFILIFELSDPVIGALHFLLLLCNNVLRAHQLGVTVFLGKVVWIRIYLSSFKNQFALQQVSFFFQACEALFLF